MPFGVTFQYHSQKSTSSRFSVLSGSCLTAGGHAASFINQVCIILVNSFAIPGGIMNGAGREAQACTFLCFRARNMIMCSSGVLLVPFFALAISRASLNSGLLREHVCCHMFLPARVFLSGLGNIPVTERFKSIILTFLYNPTECYLGCSERHELAGTCGNTHVPSRVLNSRTPC